MPAPTSATPTKYAASSSAAPAMPPTIAAITIGVVSLRAEHRARRQRADDEAEHAEHDLEQAIAEEAGQEAAGQQDGGCGNLIRGRQHGGCRRFYTSRRPSIALPTAEVVGVIEIAADRDAGRDARDAQAERLEQPRQIDRRGLAFDGRIGREDHFFDAAAGDAREQALDLQIVRARRPAAARSRPSARDTGRGSRRCDRRR